MLEATADGSWWKLNAYTVIIHKLKPSSDLHFSEESLWADGESSLFFVRTYVYENYFSNKRSQLYTHKKYLKILISQFRNSSSSMIKKRYSSSSSQTYRTKKRIKS